MAAVDRSINDGRASNGADCPGDREAGLCVPAATQQRDGAPLQERH